MKLKNYLLIATLFVANNYILFRQFALFFASLFFRDTHKLERIPLLNALKKPTFSKTLLGVLFLLLSSVSFAQTYKTFSIRKNIELRGKMLVVGNNILGKENHPFNVPFNDANVANQDVSMKYIDIDNDATPGVFSSSSADLVVPKQKDGSPTTCYRVAYAALYWGAMLKDTDGSRANINKIKLKLPGAATYTDITGEVVHDAIVSPIPVGSGEKPNTPYACYADVTSSLNGLPNLNGTYTVANVISSQGSNGSTGLSAGWTLFVVYEDPSLNTKSFTVFDGFSQIFNTKVEEIPVTGFTTPLSGNIDLQFAYAALDGDATIGATKLEFGTKQVTTPFRPANRFFNATIENTNGVSTPRFPDGTNTLGYDTGVLEVIGAQPEYIDNGKPNVYNETNFSLQVANGKADPVFAFFSAYAVDIIAPKIDLTKIVKNSSGTDIGGGNVNLGQFITYEISYQSVGNDNVTNFTIKDVLPINITFNPLTDLVLPPGVTVDPIVKYDALGNQIAGYNSVTRTIIFKIDDAYVKVDGALWTIKLNVRVATDCNSLVTACSNEIKNQAFATYQGVINPKIVKEEGSFASTACKLGSPESTNFLVDISKCTFTQNVILCGSSVVLKASDGYSNYSWSRNQDGSSPIGTGQTFTATQPGIYYVHNTAPATCKDIVEEITVKYFGVTNTNPVIPFADQVVQCSNDGKLLPYIFLCGANATKLIKTGISGTTSIVWERLDEVACPSTAIANCANETFANSCWKSVGTEPDYLANTSGQFRVTLRYPNGCFSVFYFNVYQNLLSPTFSKKDIICGTPGEIIIGDVPNGYEYSIDGINYQLNDPKFIITAPGIYTVYIKQNGVTTFPCIFKVPNIKIDKRDLNVRTFVTQPSCHGVSDGSIKLIAENVEPQYYFSIYQGTTEINSVGPISDNFQTFDKLSPGDYTVKVFTDPAKCVYTDIVKIIDPKLLEVKVDLSKALTCVNGELTINVLGGTANYNYYVNGIDVLLNTALTTITVPVPTAQKYDIKVVDVNNCEATTSITVVGISPPVYTVTPTNILCYGSNSGEIKFVVTNDNGYTLSYGISTDNGLTYSYGINPTISNLAAGVYYVNLKYSLNDTDCFGTPEKITITEPAAALTASAGVSELAGCDPSGSGYGKVRITNPQGGTPFPGADPYLYSFDNQKTWVNTNEAYVAPGTYTLYIKDANGCIFPMPGIILEEKPLAPTIKVSDPVFNCDGSATSTVTVTNSGSNSFSYTYLLDGKPNPNTADPKTFLNVPTGPHTISVNYTLTSVPTYSNLLNEDFGKGAPTTTSGIASAYCFNDQRVNPPYLCTFPNGTPSQSVEDNAYSVASFFWRSDDPLGNNTGAWYHFKDHTVFNPAVTDGRYLLVNIGSAAGPYGVLYSKPINNVIPNQPLIVDLYLGNLIRSTKSGVDPDFIIEIVDSSGNLITPGQATGAIPKNEIWNKKTLSFNPGANTSLTFKIRSGSVAYSGNDAVIDDIKVYQLPKVCATEVKFPFEVASGKAFTASVTGFKNVKCAGDSNGEITIAAQNFNSSYQYTIDGTNWTTVTTSPYTIKPLAVGIYTVQIRYDTTGTCSFSFQQEIKAPLPLKVDATATPAKCSVGATVTASAIGGTLAYEFQLDNPATAGIDYPFTNNAVFTDIPPGTYVVSGKDANGCTDNRDANLVIDPPAGVSAVVQNTGLCFDGSNATITVNVSGGTGSYSYQTSIDGGTNYSPSSLTFTGPLASFTYTATETGTYMFKITDSFGCSTTVSQVINAKLLAGAAVTTGLDCDAPPANQAIITGTISGGTAPFNVVKLTVTDPGGVLVQPTVTGTTFTYTTAMDGTYTFEITDAIGCKTTTAATVIPFVPVTVNPTKVDPTCNGSTDGSIKLTALTGEAPFTYSITGVGGLSSTNVFGGLAAGTYSYIVRDNKGCDATGTIVLDDPAPIVPDIKMNPITCDVNTLGSFDVSVVSGGVAPFTYKLYDNAYNLLSTYVENGASLPAPPVPTAVHEFAGLNFGDYYITIVDAKGCEFKSAKLRIETPPYLALTGTIVDSGSCKDGVDVTVTTSGGEPDYKFSIFGQPLTEVGPFASPVYTFEDLKHGTTYFLQVKDKNGCVSILEIKTPPPPTPIKITGTTVTNVICTGTATGTLAFTVSGYDPTVTDIDYEVLNALTLMPLATPVNGTLTGAAGGPVTMPLPPLPPLSLPAGNYVLRVSEVGGTECSATFTFEITQPAQPLLSAIASVVNANCDKPAQITLTTTGGTGPYTYAFAVAPATPTVFASGNVLSLDPGALGTDLNWNIIVKDLNGCTFSLPTTITKDPSPVIALTVVDKCAVEGAFGIKVTATTAGTGAYTISVNGSTFNSISGLPHTVTGLNSGLNTIKIKDANGCIDTKTITIDKPLQLRFAISVVPTCSDADGEVTLTASGGTIPANYQYSKDGSIYGITNVFPGLAPNTYTFWVKDMVTLCTKSVTVVIENPNPTINFGLTKTDVTCNGDSDGTITVDLDPSTSTVNNNPIYRYTLTETLTGAPVRSIQDANIFSGLPAGNYTVTVTSGRGCKATAPITIIEPAIITVPAPTVVQYRCNAGSNATNYATITVTGVTGGSGVVGVYANYQFIKDGTEVYFGPSNVYTETDLLGGNYTINVYDDKRCSGTVTTAIDPFIALDKVSVNVDKAITCLAGEDITVSVSSIGGTPDNLRITIEDVLYDAVTGTAIKGTIYSDFKDVTVPTASFTGLPVGNYLITVDNLDTGCSIKTVHYVNEPNTFDLKIDNVVDVTCFDATDGSANITFIDRVISATDPDQAGAFNYTVVDASGNTIVPLTNSLGAGPVTVTNLASGIYTVTATLSDINSSMCSVTKNFTITGPAIKLAIAETHTPITCATGDGTISATATGGWPGGYEFQLELAGTPGIPVAGYAWSSVSEFTGLSSSLVDYTVRVRDSKLCSSAFVDVKLLDPTPIAATIVSDKTLLNCFGNKDATITVTSATGGSGSYLYTLVTTYPDGTVTKNGPQQSTIFSGLGAGSYQVLVSDNWSCFILSNTIVINEPTEVKPNLVLASRITCATQATLTLSATGGTGLYTYSTDPNFVTPLGTFATSVTFPVPVGTYHYYVKDANGCVSYLSNDIKIDPLVPLTINLENENPVINCAGDNTGVIVATAQGGLGNYAYTLTNVTTGVVTDPQPTGNFTGLIAGTYTVHVDSEDCDADKNVTITEPDTPLTAAPLATFNVTCNGFGNGKIVISASGGTGIIKYAISPRFDQWFETGIFDKLKPGFYDIMAQDQNGCYVRFTGIEITEPTAITPSTVAGSIVPEICFGDNDGAFSIDVTGGTASYSVSLDNINGTYTNGASGQTRFDFTGLTGGDHIVYIRDANLCTAQWTVSLPESIKLDPKTIVDYGCSGNSPSNSVTVTIDASITNPADVDYSLDGVSPYQPSNVFTNVPPGIHFIRVRHTNGCEKDTPDFEILKFDPLALTIADGGLNEIVATATGGAGGYQYTFNGEDNGGNNKYIIYKSGDYAVTVTDANGCVASATRYFEYIDVCVPNYFTPNGDGVMDGWAPGCTINYKDLTFDIFDRYGRKIATYRLGQYWDGKYNGAELPSGDYWYVLKLNDLKDAREFVGHFTLYR